VLPATSVKYRIRGSGRSDEKPRRGGAARASEESPPGHGSDLHWAPLPAVRCGDAV